MCQPKSNGGKRCAIHRHDTLATTKYLMETTSLSRGQIEHIFTSITSSRRDDVQIPHADWVGYLDQLEQASAAVDSKVLERNIQKARTQGDAPSARVFYALSNLPSKAKKASKHLDFRLRSIAQDAGEEYESVRERFVLARDKVVSGSSQNSPDDVMKYCQQHHLPTDRGTIAGLQAAMHRNIDSSPRIQLHSTGNEFSDEKEKILSTGYDSSDGRLELEISRHGTESRVVYQNVPASVYAKFSTAHYSVEFYRKNIESRDVYQYESTEDAVKNAGSAQCKGCGRFTAPSGHSCPSKSISTLSDTTSNNNRMKEVEVESGEAWFPDRLFENPLRPTLEELAGFDDVLRASRELTKITLPEDPAPALARVRHENVRIPVEAEFQSFHDPCTVSGFVDFHADDKGLNPVERDLTCTCRREHTCSHIIATAHQSGYFLTSHDPSLDKPRMGFTRLTDHPYGGVNHVHDETIMARTIQRKQLGRGIEFSEAQARVEMDIESKKKKISAEEQKHEKKMRRQRPVENDNALRSRKIKVNKRMLQEMRASEVHLSVYDQHRELLQQLWSQRTSDYTNDSKAFFSDYEDARKRGIVYQYSNALGTAGTGEGARRFGVELEFDFPRDMGYEDKMERRQKIGRALHDAGLTENSSQDEYGATRGNAYPDRDGSSEGDGSGKSRWSFQEDGTVEGEVVSPPMRDTPESWQELEKVCEILKAHGAVASVKCGSHVHVSSGSYGHSTAKHTELHRTVIRHEDLLYRLSTSPKTGVHRGTEYCAPNIDDRGKEVPDQDLAGWRRLPVERKNGVNFKSSSLEESKGGSNASHIEFRTWDATLDPGVIQQQIKLSVAMIDGAERRVAEKGQADALPSSRTRLGDTRQKEEALMKSTAGSGHTQETFSEVNHDLAVFLDQHFPEREQRMGILALFAKTSWQRSVAERKAINEVAHGTGTIMH